MGQLQEKLCEAQQRIAELLKPMKALERAEARLRKAAIARNESRSIYFDRIGLEYYSYGYAEVCDVERAKRAVAKRELTEKHYADLMDAEQELEKLKDAAKQEKQLEKAADKQTGDQPCSKRPRNSL